MSSRFRRRVHGTLPTGSMLSLLCVSAFSALAILSLLSGYLPDMEQLSGNPTQVTDESPEDLDSTHLILELLKQSYAWKALDGAEKEQPWISKQAEAYYGCSNFSSPDSFAGAGQNTSGYLIIEASGGLNQQRIGITDAVVVAHILNATLVLPELDHKSFWKDSSNFSDIFDVQWFVNSLAGDLRIVKEVPLEIRNRSKHNHVSVKVPRKCPPSYYYNKILPILRRKQVLRIKKFDFRLANRLDRDLQKLRCRVNYHALRFTQPIRSLGQTLVSRMRQKSRRFLALHLRFEPDMLAFSGCYYGGGEKEIRELGAIRRRWKTLHVRSPERARRNGKCLLTPLEVGLMLRALGYSHDSHVYVASGEIYGGEAMLAPLKAMFPNYLTKEILAKDEELQPFVKYSSQMAAIDFVVCDESDVFFTNNNGNMARILAGRRRYFGHKRTIRPNTKKLGQLFMAKHSNWERFAAKLQTCQKGFMGDPDELKPGRGNFYEYPADCICKNSPPSVGSVAGLGSADTVFNISPNLKDAGDLVGESKEEDGQDALNPEEKRFDLDEGAAGQVDLETAELRQDYAEDLYLARR